VVVINHPDWIKLAEKILANISNTFAYIFEIAATIKDQMESSEAKFENPEGWRRRSSRALEKSAKKATSLRVTSPYFARKSAAGQIVQKKVAVSSKKKAGGVSPHFIYF
jgi:hypothetical protein